MSDELNQAATGQESAPVSLSTVEYIAKNLVRGKLMAVDYGDVRTGVAFSDEGQTMAFGQSTISPGAQRKTVLELSKLARENKAVAVVVGNPINMDGSHGPRSQKMKDFALMLARRIHPIPVALFDERMTTMVAARYLNETNTRGQKRKAVIDTLSAQIILQNALDRIKSLRERP